MRHITKGIGDICLQQRYDNYPQPINSHEATQAWKRFSSHKKRRTANVCLGEQFNLCGYTEISINDESPLFDDNNNYVELKLGYHIEHVEPKSNFPDKTFLHNNLIISCISSQALESMDHRDVFGGHRKGKWFNSDAFISPLLTNCNDYFHYLSNGKIVPSDNLKNKREKAKARLTIYRLNLNSNYLVNIRRAWITKALEIINDLDNHELKLFAEGELLPVNDKLRPFHSALRQTFGKLGNEICQPNNI